MNTKLNDYLAKAWKQHIKDMEKFAFKDPQGYKDAFDTIITKTWGTAQREEHKRCVDLLDCDHSTCPIKETCIGYQNAQSDLINQPPHN